MIAVLDTGCGNLRSVVRALEASGAKDVTVTRDADTVSRAERLLFPGQGAFGDCAAALERDGGALSQALRSAIGRGAQYLGICLGMQVLFERSEEAPGAAGLGLFAGDVVRLEGSEGVKIPHMGWNDVRLSRAHDALSERDWFYFVHSYACAPTDASVSLGEAEHGQRFCAAVARDNVLAVQFHPEKSQRAGLSLLERWLKR